MDDDLKARLLAPRAGTASGFPEAWVNLTGGGSVLVRGLSRLEAMHVQGGSAATIERRMIAIGMLSPAMSEAEVGAWQKVALAGELDPVSNKISELSGLLATSAKEATRAMLDDDEGAGFRALLGGAPEHDGNAPAG